MISALLRDHDPRGRGGARPGPEVRSAGELGGFEPLLLQLLALAEQARQLRVQRQDRLVVGGPRGELRVQLGFAVGQPRELPLEPGQLLAGRADVARRRPRADRWTRPDPAASSPASLTRRSARPGAARGTPRRRRAGPGACRRRAAPPAGRRSAPGGTGRARPRPACRASRRARPRRRPACRCRGRWSARRAAARWARPSAAAAAAAGAARRRTARATGVHSRSPVNPNRSSSWAGGDLAVADPDRRRAPARPPPARAGRPARRVRAASWLRIGGADRLARAGPARLLGAELAQHQPQQRGLARAVHADDADPVARRRAAR